MRRTNKIPRYTLSKNKVKKLIDNGAAAGIQSLSFTGGEPLLYIDDIVELIQYATAGGIPYIRTGTNGFFLMGSEQPNFEKKISIIAEKLASTQLYTFWISLDSANPMDHESLRGLPGVVKGIEKALPIFHDHGIYPSVNLGINRATGGLDNQPYLESMDGAEFEESFRSAFERFYGFVESLGFTIVNACYPMSDHVESNLDSSLYGAASSESIITFSKTEKELIFSALFATIPNFRGRLRIFSPRCSLYSLIKKFKGNHNPLFSCRGGSDFFFVDSEKGAINPCGYLNNPLEKIPNLTQRNTDVKDCDQCEWECFRDPSDLMSPFAELFTQPIKLLGKILRDPYFFRILQNDLRYYKACGFFNGRQAPNFTKMGHFSSTF